MVLPALVDIVVSAQQALLVVGSMLVLAGAALYHASRRAAAERAARQKSEERLRRALGSEIMGIAFWDGTRIIDANTTFLHLLGYDRADLEAGALHGRLTPPEYADLDRDAREQLAARGACAPYEKEFLRKDGTRVPVLVGGTVLDREDRNILFFVLDLTERRRAAEQWQATQRLETVGQLAGGIAHEANNQMTVILGATNFLLQRTDLPHEAQHDIQQVRQAAEQTATITQQLLAFSRQQVLQPRPLDLNAEIRILEPLVQRTLGGETALALRLASDIGLVRADPAQLTQVILNLVINARDAMPDGGTLTIATRRVDSDAIVGSVADETVAPGSYAALTIADTGHGMAPDTLRHVFEPFFTTKPVGEGTGLGLATVHGIVRQSGGHVTVDSTPGHGTTFTIYLPHAEASAGVSDAVTAEAPSTEDSSGTILVVDDQPHVRGMLARLLEQEGYTVLDAGSGTEALAAVAGDGKSLDLVITDLVMPKMDGGELARQLAHTHPEVPILFTSGHAHKEMRRRGLLDAGRPFLQKPYAANVLIAQVQQLLARRASLDDDGIGDNEIREDEIGDDAVAAEGDRAQ